MIDRNKSWCYNCNELGHFVTECKKHRQARDRKESYKKKNLMMGWRRKMQSWNRSWMQWLSNTREELILSRMKVGMILILKTRRIKEILLSRRHTNPPCRHNQYHLHFRYYQLSTTWMISTIYYAIYYPKKNLSSMRRQILPTFTLVIVLLGYNKIKMGQRA